MFRPGLSFLISLCLANNSFAVLAPAFDRVILAPSHEAQALVQQQAVLEPTGSYLHPIIRQTGVFLRQLLIGAVLLTAAHSAAWTDKNPIKKWFTTSPYAAMAIVNRRRRRREPSAIRKPEWSQLGRETAADIYRPEQTTISPDHMTLSRIIMDMLKFDLWVDRLEPETFSKAHFQSAFLEFSASDAFARSAIRDRMNDDETSFAVFLETFENHLLLEPGKPFDLSLVTLPTATTNLLTSRYNIPGLTDAFKKRLHESLVDKGIIASMSGGTLYIEGQDPQWFVKNMDGFLERARKIILADPHITALVSPEKMAAFAEDLQGLKFYASAIPLCIQTPPPGYDAPSGARDIKRLTEKLNRLTKELETPDDPKSATASQRRIQLEDLYVGQQLLREKLSVMAGYWLTQPDGRKQASEYTELYLYHGVLEAKARAELSEKHPDALQTLIHGIINGTKDLPLLDERSLTKIEKELREQAVLKDGHLLTLFFEQMLMGRKKMVSPYNFHTGHLPRVMRLLPDSPQPVNDEYDKILRNPTITPELLAEFKRTYFQYRFDMYQALVRAYRDPRLEEYYKLDGIDDVLAAQQQGLWVAVKERLTLIKPYLADSDNRLAQLERLQELIISGIFFFKRTIGDELGYVIEDNKGKFWMGFGELTKAHAHQAAHGDPADLRDTTFHRIFLELLRVSRPFVGTEFPLLPSMNHWKKAILTVAPEKFVPNDKVETKGGNVQRHDAYHLKGQNPLITTHLKENKPNGKVYIQNAKGRWEPMRRDAAKGLELDPVNANLGVAQLIVPYPIEPGEAGPLFDTSDRLVVNQKKHHTLKTAITSLSSVAVKVVLALPGLPYWLANEGGKAKDILRDLRQIIPNPALLGMYDEGRLKSEVVVYRMIPEIVDGSIRYGGKRISRNTKIAVGEIIGILFPNPYEENQHTVRQAA